jgi:hypothetical protein
MEGISYIILAQPPASDGVLGRCDVLIERTPDVFSAAHNAKSENPVLQVLLTAAAQERRDPAPSKGSPPKGHELRQIF